MHTKVPTNERGFFASTRLGGSSIKQLQVANVCYEIWMLPSYYPSLTYLLRKGTYVVKCAEVVAEKRQSCCLAGPFLIMVILLNHKVVMYGVHVVI